MKLYVERDIRSHKVEVYLEESDSLGKVLIVGRSKSTGEEMAYSPGLGVVPSLDFGPFLSFDMRRWDGFMRAFAKYCNENNIATEKEDYLKGQVAGKEEHLADLRDSKEKFYKLAEGLIEQNKLRGYEVLPSVLKEG